MRERRTLWKGVRKLSLSPEHQERWESQAFPQAPMNRATGQKEAMSKHTPGDWQYKHGWIMNGEDRIAQVRGWGWLVHKHVKADGTSDHEKAAAEQDANGHLLKSAPDLLEALEEVLVLAETNDDDMFDNKEAPAILAKARAAITKAKGGQP